MFLLGDLQNRLGWTLCCCNQTFVVRLWRMMDLQQAGEPAPEVTVPTGLIVL